MNSLTKLNDALFAELDRLERIGHEDHECLRAEIDRAKAVSNLAASITNNHRLALQVARERAETHMCESISIPKMLEG